MNSVKLNKKHLFSILITVVLLVSLNFNVFAETVNQALFSYKLSEFTQYSVSEDLTLNVTDTTINEIEYTKFSFKSSSGNPVVVVYKMTTDFYKSNTYTLTFNAYKQSTPSVPVYGSLYFVKDLESSESYVLTNFTFETVATEYNINFSVPDSLYEGSTDLYLIFVMSYNTSMVSVLKNCYVSPLTFSNVDPMYGEPIETPPTDELEDSLQNYDDLVDSLPTVNPAELQDLLNFDYGSFVDGMNFVRSMFDKTLTALNFNSVLMFSLIFGLACLILGRKAGN